MCVLCCFLSSIFLILSPLWALLACVQLSEELTDGSRQSESASRQQRSKVEDILVKMIRLVANVSISVDIGRQLSCTDSLVELLLHVISM